MGEVIHVDFNDGIVTERYSVWPQVQDRAELIERAKAITAAIYLIEDTGGEKLLEALRARQQECLKEIQPLTKQLIDEIYEHAIDKASELKTEIK